MQIAVVIPFFQHRPGLLLRAVGSALAQIGVNPLVVVVDDGSPVSARRELADVECDRIIVLEQPNAGPAGARNYGIECIPPEVELVAFLDSDDVWHPEHLTNALCAFEHGADLFFSDWRRPDDLVSRFHLPRVIRPTGELMAFGYELYSYKGDLFDAILRCSPIGTSGVVYRRLLAPKLRFQTDLRAGEDNFFWMNLAQAAQTIVFTTRCEAYYGAGENISMTRWRDLRSLTHIQHAVRMHRRVAQVFELTSDQKAWNDDWCSELRDSYASNLLAMAWNRDAIRWRDVVSSIREDPRLLSKIASIAIATLSRPVRAPFSKRR